MELVGRGREIKILEQLFNSNKPEFLALYGRRRVGKTFLIRQFFKSKDAIFFYVTGSKDGSLAEQIIHFTKQISHIFLGGLELKPGTSWDETFEKLTKAFEQIPKDKKIVLFFDELPWMATPKSRLLQSLDYYWNQFWSDNPRVKLIVCGSAASWIIHKIIKNKGGLYNRITEKIHLEPFNLSETKQFLYSKKIILNNQQILLLYMAIGGIPYYLSKIKKGKSATQIIEDLAFSKNAFLLEEFDDLFASLFNDGDVHAEIVRTLAKHPYGLVKRNLLEMIGKFAVGSGGIKKLRELEETGFIMSFKPLYHKKKGIYYRLVDEYVLFYLKWIAPIRKALQEQSLEQGNWQAIQNTPECYSWLGYAFEAVCYKHISAIRKALSINPSALASSWRYAPRKYEKTQGAQIDLLFDRKDNSITLCEIKYSEEPFVLTKDYVEMLNRKMRVFKEQTRTHKQLFITIISANGLKNNYYAEDLISGVVTLDDFFKDNE
jgi:AAA+ ATPase superfamily predicted ATPase